MNPPKMPIHIGDYQRDTGHLRAAEHGAYLLLMFHYWSTGGLPDTDDHLSAIARMSRGEWNKSKATLQAFFKDGWKHGRIDFDLGKAHNISEAAREAGKASGRSRSVERPLNDRSSSVEPTLEPLNHRTKEEKKEPRAVALDDGWPADYREVFWQSYPNKVGKPKALAKLDTCRKRGVGFADIMAGLDRYIRTKPPDRAWLNPETFLNQERWTDQPAPAQQGNSNGRRTVHDAANDLVDRIGALDAPAPGGLCGPEGQGAIRLLPAR